MSVRLGHDVPKNGADYSWQESDTSLALVSGSRIIWKLNYNRNRGKPYFSPLNTIYGEDLAWLRPEDHPWHYGLWFSWKYINKKNFWEENRITNMSEGKATLDSLTKTLGKDFTATVKMQISYSLDGSKDVLREQRTLQMSPPDDAGNYFIDWSFDWTAQKDTVILDRTIPKKFDGPNYGGYAGLSYRASSDMSDHVYRHANAWISKEDLVGYGVESNWMDLSGTLSKSGVRSGLTIFNHPENIDGEVPWYIYKEGNFAFFNASFLFNKSLTILPGQDLNLKYRTLIHSGDLSRNEIDEQYKIYTIINEEGN